MVRQSKKVGFIGLSLTILFYVTILLLPMDVEAKTKVATIEGISYNVNSSLSDNLKSLIGKRVSTILNSGKTFTGVVKEVGNHFVHLQKIEGREYFDALIRIEDISAIDTRFREILR